MAWRCAWSVACDVCGSVGPQADSSTLAERLALEAGWLRALRFGVSRHACPDCAADRVPEDWSNVARDPRKDGRR